MHIRRVPNGRYNCIVRRKVDGEYIQKTATRDTRQEAEAWGILVESSLGNASMTFAQALEKFETSVVDPEEAEAETPTQRATINKKRARLHLLRKYFGKKTLEEITPEVVEGFRDYRMGQVVGSTTRKDLFQLQRVYTWLIENRKLYHLSNPVKSVRMPRETRKSAGQIVAQTAYAQIMNELGGEHGRIYESLMWSAMRLSEVMYLQWSWIDFDEYAIFLPEEMTKTRKSRAVPMFPEFERVLRRQWEYTKDQPAVWTIQYDTFRRKYHRARKRVDLNRLRLHDLRHTAITREVKRQDSLAAVQMVSGHKNIRTLVDKYTHLTLRDLKGMDR